MEEFVTKARALLTLRAALGNVVFDAQRRALLRQAADTLSAPDAAACFVRLAELDGALVDQRPHAHLLNQQNQLPEPIPFRNFVAQARHGVSEAEHEAFFCEMLGDVDEPTTPFGLSEARGDGSGMNEAHYIMDQDLAERLRAQARSMGISVASLCHLAWGLVD